MTRNIFSPLGEVAAPRQERSIMDNGRQADWNPRSEAVLSNPTAAYDEMRRQCPVAYSEYLHWSLFRHDNVTRVLGDPQTFSNAAGSHLSVPNGMDPPQHTEYRRIIEPYFDSQRMKVFEPACRRVAVDLLAQLVLPTAPHDDAGSSDRRPQDRAARAADSHVGGCQS